jgi:SAM-dependent methyltransferase
MTAAAQFAYVGSELDLFAEVHNWKAYWSGLVQPYIHGDVLEVGAGLGANTRLLSKQRSESRWVCLEPDSGLSTQTAARLADLNGVRNYEIVCGTMAAIPDEPAFDTIIYIDVLEHIEDDAGEMRAAALRLRPNGHIIVLSPAHQWLFTPFDAAIGHFRRYNKASLRSTTPPGTTLNKLFYVDVVGIAASATNRLFLQQSLPQKSQLATWDRWMIPVSRVVDPLIGRTLGKSIIGVWRKQGS